MRYLIFGGPGIGDTIFELALAKAIKKVDCSATVDVLKSVSSATEKTLMELMTYQEYVDNEYFWNKRDIKKVWRTFIKLRKNYYNYGIACGSNFKPSKTAGKVCRMLRCKSVVKEVKGKTDRIDIPVNVDDELHIVDQYKTVVNAILPVSEIDCDVLNSDLLKPIIENNSKEIISICIGTNITYYYHNGRKISKNIKEYSIERWVHIANVLADKYRVILLGGTAERERLLPYEKELKATVENMVGQTSIHDSLSVINQSKLVVGADTGMMHCAAALNKATVTLFGGTAAKTWKPYSKMSYIIEGKEKCAPCYGKKTAIKCKQRNCMNRISETEVLELIFDVLEKR